MQNSEKSDSLKQLVCLQPMIEPYICDDWIRMLIRKNKVIQSEFHGLLKDQDFNFKFRIKAFGVSDNENTMKTENSWFIEENLQVKPLLAFYQGVYPKYELPGYKIYHNSQLLNKNMFLANYFNGKTPTGTEWSATYDESYILFQGKVRTYGNWESFWYGCGKTAKIGDNNSFRVGGGVKHSGQFIHSCCNDYKMTDHAITSLISWDNKRVIWIKVQK